VAGPSACEVSSVSVQPFVDSTPTLQTESQDRQTDKQRTDSIGRTVLQTVAQKGKCREGQRSTGDDGRILREARVGLDIVIGPATNFPVPHLIFRAYKNIITICSKAYYCDKLAADGSFLPLPLLSCNHRRLISACLLTVSLNVGIV